MKACWWCVDFMYTQADFGWGEYTPGTNFQISCLKNKWQFDTFNDSQEKFGEVLSSAETCPDFKSIK